MSNLSAPHFHNEEAAYAYVEARIWPKGAICPHCGGVDRVGKLAGKSTRVGLWKCYQCRKPFTVKIGTIFEDSKVPMRLWLQAVHLIASSKKGISSNQLHRILGVTLKTAWFMSHRIRLAMQTLGIEPMGGPGKVVEVDETFFGKLEGAPKDLGSYGRASTWRNIVVTLVERGGSARSYHVDERTLSELSAIVVNNVSSESHLMTDEWRAYMNIGRQFASHQTVTHSV